MGGLCELMNYHSTAVRCRAGEQGAPANESFDATVKHDVFAAEVLTVSLSESVERRQPHTFRFDLMSTQLINAEKQVNSMTMY